jgi:hypothetical protein
VHNAGVLNIEILVQALNNAYQNAVEAAGLYRGTGSVSLTNGTDDYEIAL